VLEIDTLSRLILYWKRLGIDRRRTIVNNSYVGKKRLLLLYLGVAVLLLSSSLFPLAGNNLVSASPDRLKWSIVETPSEEDKV
jgi:hypothetical protein